MHLLSLLLLFFIATGESKNLVVNGDFEQSGRVPLEVIGWQPLRFGYERIDTKTDRGHAIRFTIPRKVARSEGFQFYSDRFAIVQDQPYRCRAEVRSNGPKIVLFVNGYAKLDGKERLVYRDEIKSNSRLKKDKWSWLDFEFTPRQPSFVSNKVVEHRLNRMGPVDLLEVEFFIHGSDGGVVEVDNVSIVRIARHPQTRAIERAASGPVE